MSTIVGKTVKERIIDALLAAPGGKLTTAELSAAVQKPRKNLGVWYCKESKLLARKEKTVIDRVGQGPDAVWKLELLLGKEPRRKPLVHEPVAVKSLSQIPVELPPVSTTTTKRNSGKRIVWDAGEIAAIAYQAALNRLNFNDKIPTQGMQLAVDAVLPPHRRRKIVSMALLPKELIEQFDYHCINMVEKLKHPEPELQVATVQVPVEEVLPKASTEQLYAEIGRRQDDMYALLTAVSTKKAAEFRVPLPEAPAHRPAVKAKRILIIGLHNGEVIAVKGDAKVSSHIIHKNIELVSVLVWGDDFARANLDVDVVMVSGKPEGDKFWYKLKASQIRAKMCRFNHLTDLREQLVNLGVEVLDKKEKMGVA